MNRAIQSGLFFCLALASPITPHAAQAQPSAVVDAAFVPVRAYLAYLPPERQSGLRFEYRFGGAVR